MNHRGLTNQPFEPSRMHALPKMYPSSVYSSPDLVFRENIDAAVKAKARPAQYGSRLMRNGSGGSVVEVGDAPAAAGVARAARRLEGQLKARSVDCCCSGFGQLQNAATTAEATRRLRPQIPLT